MQRRNANEAHAQRAHWLDRGRDVHLPTVRTYAQRRSDPRSVRNGSAADRGKPDGRPLMTTAKRTTCGLCGQMTRHIGSHVISAHVPFAAGMDATSAALVAERKARFEKVT